MADCTGHGVPGAFLSMIGNMLLNKIVNEDNSLSPAIILERLHDDMRKVLKQNGKQRQGNEGMDIGLCQIDLDNNKVVFAGARRPLYLIISNSNGEDEHNKLIEIKGDRKSIGGRQKEEKRQFTNHELEIHEGDMLYMSSDGLVDQHNAQDEKLGSVKLQAKLEAIAHKNMVEQKELLLELLHRHQNNESQRDDITLVGVQIAGAQTKNVIY